MGAFSAYENNDHVLRLAREEEEYWIKQNKVAAYALVKRNALDQLDPLGITEELGMTEDHKLKLAELATSNSHS